MRTKRMRKKISVGRVIGVLILLIAIVIAIYPFIWMLISSFKTDMDFLTNKLGLPKEFTLENYIQAWGQGDFPTYFLNSILVSAGSLVLMIGTAAMASFAFTRYRFSASKALLNYFIIGQMLSAQIVLIAVYLVMVNMNLDDSLGGLMLVYAASGLPFTVFLLQGFFKSLPSELFEAAEIDGYNEWRIFARIALPLCLPGLSAALIVQFMYVWNEFPLALVVMKSPEKTTLPVGIYRIINDMYYSSKTLACAGLAIAALPIIVIYAVFQKQIIGGMTAGALKG